MRTEWSEWDLTIEAWKAPSRVTAEEYRQDGKHPASSRANEVKKILKTLE